MSTKKHKAQKNDLKVPAGIKIIQKNKKANFEYEILDTYECGIMLLGPEVKAIRSNQVLFADCFAKIRGNTIQVHNLHISQYKFYTGDPIDPVRIRTLLLHRQELKKINRQVEEKGLTLVPLSIYLKNGLIKISLGVGRGKRLYDKKETLKQKDAERESAREIKSYFKG